MKMVSWQNQYFSIYFYWCIQRVLLHRDVKITLFSKLIIAWHAPVSVIRFFRTCTLRILPWLVDLQQNMNFLKMIWKNFIYFFHTFKWEVAIKYNIFKFRYRGIGQNRCRVIQISIHISNSSNPQLHLNTSLEKNACNAKILKPAMGK